MKFYLKHLSVDLFSKEKFKLFKSVSILIMIRGGAAISALLMNYVIARLHMPDVSGQFFTYSSLVVILSQFVVFGYSNVIHKYVSDYYNLGELDEVDKLTSSIFKLAFCVSLLLFIIEITYIKEISLILRLSIFSLYFLMFNVFFQALILIIASCFQGASKPNHSILLTSISQPVILSLILLIFDNINIYILYSISIFVTLLISLYLWYAKENKKFYIKVSIRYDINLIKIFILLVFNLILLHWPVIYSNVFLSSEDAALVNVCLRIASLVTLISVIINMFISPKISKLFVDNKINNLKKLINEIVKINFIMSFLFLVFCLTFSKYLLLFFGEFYLRGYDILIILLIYQSLVNVFSIFGLVLLMIGEFNKLVFSIGMNLFVVLLMIYLYHDNMSPLIMSIIISIAGVFQILLIINSVIISLQRGENENSIFHRFNK